MTESSPAFLVTRLLGISSSVFLSGFAFSASYYGIPAIVLAPLPLRLTQWQVIYDLGKLVSPPVSALSAALWGVAAWISHGQHSEDWKFYATAGAFTFAVPLWTVVVMLPTNNDLMKKAKLGGELEAESESFKVTSEKALVKWDRMNMVRAVLPMVGAWVGLYAALK